MADNFEQVSNSKTHLLDGTPEDEMRILKEWMESMSEEEVADAMSEKYDWIDKVVDEELRKMDNE